MDQKLTWKKLKSFKHFDLHGEKLSWASVGIMQLQENHSIVSLSCIVINWSRPKLSNITNAKVCCSVLMSNSKCNPLFTRHVQFLSISTNAKWHLPLGKGELISESFTLGARIFKRKVPNHSPELYSPKEKMLRIVIGHLFWEIWVKVKNFLRLSHLWSARVLG